jgi:hypothetical protein
VAATNRGKLCFCYLPYFVFSGVFSRLGAISMFLILGVCSSFGLLFFFLKCCRKEDEIIHLMREKTSLRHNLEIVETSRELWRKDFYSVKEKLDAIKQILELES